MIKRVILLVIVPVLVATLVWYAWPSSQSGASLAEQAATELLKDKELIKGDPHTKIERWFYLNVMKRTAKPAFRNEFIEVFREQAGDILRSAEAKSTPMLAGSVVREAFAKARYTNTEVDDFFKQIGDELEVAGSPSELAQMEVVARAIIAALDGWHPSQGSGKDWLKGPALHVFSPLAKAAIEARDAQRLGVLSRELRTSEFRSILTTLISAIEDSVFAQEAWARCELPRTAAPFNVRCGWFLVEERSPSPLLQDVAYELANSPDLRPGMDKSFVQSRYDAALTSLSTVVEDLRRGQASAETIRLASLELELAILCGRPSVASRWIGLAGKGAPAQTRQAVQETIAHAVIGSRASGLPADTYVEVFEGILSDRDWAAAPFWLDRLRSSAQWHEVRTSVIPKIDRAMQFESSQTSVPDEFLAFHDACHRGADGRIDILAGAKGPDRLWDIRFRKVLQRRQVDVNSVREAMDLFLAWNPTSTGAVEDSVKLLATAVADIVTSNTRSPENSLRASSMFRELADVCEKRGVGTTWRSHIKAEASQRLRAATTLGLHESLESIGLLLQFYGPFDSEFYSDLCMDIARSGESSLGSASKATQQLQLIERISPEARGAVANATAALAGATTTPEWLQTNAINTEVTFAELLGEMVKSDQVWQSTRVRVLENLSSAAMDENSASISLLAIKTLRGNKRLAADAPLPFSIDASLELVTKAVQAGRKDVPYLERVLYNAPDEAVSPSVRRNALSVAVEFGTADQAPAAAGGHDPVRIARIEVLVAAYRSMEDSEVLPDAIVCRKVSAYLLRTGRASESEQWWRWRLKRGALDPADIQVADALNSYRQYRDRLADWARPGRSIEVYSVRRQADGLGAVRSSIRIRSISDSRVSGELAMFVWGGWTDVGPVEGQVTPLGIVLSGPARGMPSKESDASHFSITLTAGVSLPAELPNLVLDPSAHRAWASWAKQGDIYHVAIDYGPDASRIREPSYEYPQVIWVDRWMRMGQVEGKYYIDSVLSHRVRLGSGSEGSELKGVVALTDSHFERVQKQGLGSAGATLFDIVWNDWRVRRDSHSPIASVAAQRWLISGVVGNQHTESVYLEIQKGADPTNPLVFASVRWEKVSSGESPAGAPRNSNGAPRTSGTVPAPPPPSGTSFPIPKHAADSVLAAPRTRQLLSPLFASGMKQPPGAPRGTSDVPGPVSLSGLWNHGALEDSKAGLIRLSQWLRQPNRFNDRPLLNDVSGVDRMRFDDMPETAREATREAQRLLRTYGADMVRAGLLRE